MFSLVENEELYEHPVLPHKFLKHEWPKKKKKKAKEDRLRAESCVSIREKSCYICLTVKGTSTASASDYLYFITCSYMDVKINSLSLVHLFP